MSARRSPIFNVVWIKALVVAKPTVVPTMELKYELDVTAGQSSLGVLAVIAMNATESTRPFPKPLVILLVLILFRYTVEEDKSVLPK
jgi:hypothetical protein